MSGEGHLYRTRDVVTLLLAAACTALELGLHLAMGISVVYTHLYYPVLVLAAFWYREKAAILAAYLGILHVSVSTWMSGAPDTAAIGRAVLFVVVALVAGHIVARMEGDSRSAAEYLVSRSQRLRGPLSALARNIHGLRTDLGGISAVRKMGETGDMAGLVATLGHRDPDLRYAAAEALAGMEAKEAVPPLVRALGDPHQGVRWKAAEALGRMGRDALPAVAAALESPDADVRWRVAVVLGDIGGAGATEALIRALRDDDRYVRSRAEQALGRIGPDAVGPLLDLFGRGDPRARQAAAAALGWTRDPAAIGPLIAALGEEDPGIPEAAAAALESMGQRSVEPLMGALSHPQTGVRQRAAGILGRLGDPRAVPVLRAVLSDPDPAVRHAAGEALAAMGGEALEDLFRMIAGGSPAGGNGDQGL
ncbi:MAG: HEAT repeat domain-containing protein [Methanomicrobiales archaeon]|nr:HEAT repeat domain-containing protein [Methanomicrobiales archaeon]